MNKFLEEYGGLLIAILVAAALIPIMAWTKSTDNELINSQFKSEYYNQTYASPGELVGGEKPDITVYENVTIEKDSEIDPADFILSAYGVEATDDVTFEINVISEEDSKSQDKIKNALIAGKVNIVYPGGHDTSKEGTFTIDYYVKNENSDVWAVKTCKVSVSTYTPVS